MSKNGFKDYGMKIVIAVGLAASIGLRSYGIFFQAPDSSEDNGPPKPAYINLKESKTQKEFRKRRQKIVSVGQNKKNTLTKKFQQQSTFLLEKSRKKYSENRAYADPLLNFDEETKKEIEMLYANLQKKCDEISNQMISELQWLE